MGGRSSSGVLQKYQMPVLPLLARADEFVFDCPEHQSPFVQCFALVSACPYNMR